ncbi:hypothetical protein R3P38DRAFT_2931969 [Favolaschia claudopus]|uniref:Uncharacterized protein n=1 Tax=Favolaschia claudopus TaxID=2862362 RepID=A0AAW0BUD9_9AGAR
MVQIKVEESSPNIQQFPAADSTLPTDLDTVQHQLELFYIYTESTGEALGCSIKQLSTIDGDHIPSSKVQSLSDVIGKLKSLSEDLAKLKGNLREIDVMLSNLAPDTQQPTRNEESAYESSDEVNLNFQNEFTAWADVDIRVRANSTFSIMKLCPDSSVTPSSERRDGRSGGQYDSPADIVNQLIGGGVLTNISGGRGGDGGAGIENGGAGGVGYAPIFTAEDINTWRNTIMIDSDQVSGGRGGDGGSGGRRGGKGEDGQAAVVQIAGVTLHGGKGGRGGRGGVANGKDGISEHMNNIDARSSIVV